MRGASAVELVATAPILIIMTVLSIDLAALLLGADFCDRACKDCARAAGQMPTPDEAVNAMNAAAAAHKIDGTLFRKMYPELLVYEDYNSSGLTPTPKYGSTPDYLARNGPYNITPTYDKALPKDVGANLKASSQATSPGPYVTVSNTLIIRIPVIFTFFGSKLFVGNIESDPNLFKMQSTYTFPITNTYSPSANLVGK